ncbi:MAG TPA: ABC transporter substrate-binding protein [Candidatus Bipolaricaulota bacterium]
MNKKLLTLLVLIGLGLGIIVGAAGQAQAQAGGLPGDPFVVVAAQMPDGPGTRGGSLTMDNIDNPKTFNPITQNEASSSAVTTLLNEALVDGFGNPTLAQSLEISADQKTLTIKLREGLRFSDGTPLTAADVAFTLNDVVFNAKLISTLKDAWQVAGQFPKVEALDTLTVRISAPVTFSGMLSALAGTPILPKRLLEQAANDGTINTAWGVTTPLAQIAGVGPFRLKSYTPDQQVVLERNPYYWKADENGVQLPYLDQVILSIVTDDNVRLLRFSNGQTDIYPPRPEDIPVLRQQSNQGVTVSVQEAGTVDMNVIAFNQDSQDANLQALFRDVRFRQAASYATNRQGMISANLNSLGEVRYGPGISSLFWIGDDASFPSYAFDLAKASSLLDQIGLAKGADGMRTFADGSLLEFTLLTVQGSTVLTSDAVLWANDLAKLGIKVNVRPLPLNALIDQLVGSSPPQFEAVRITLTGGDGDPNLLRAIFESGGSLHFWKFSDGAGQDVPAWQQQVDRLLQQQAQTLDLTQRANLLADFQILVAQNQPVVFLYNAQGLETYRADRVGNFTGTVENTTLLNPEILFRK